jgi:hypothetical protein
MLEADGHPGIFVINISERRHEVGFGLGPKPYSSIRPTRSRATRLNQKGEITESKNFKLTIPDRGMLDGHDVLFPEVAPLP